MKRIGHKGAHSIEHGNTIASFQAALDLQVELIEFDIIRHPYPGGRLVLAHDPDDAIAREATTLITLEEGLDLLASPDFSEIGLDVDMKHGGYELELLDALRSRRLTSRTMVTTMELDSIRLLRRQISPGELRLGLTIPRVTRDWLSMPAYVKPLLALGVFYHRLRQPRRVARLLRDGTIDAVMAFHMLVSERLAGSVHEAGGELFAWTVDELEELQRLQSLGVDGVVSNDPRLFGQLLRDRK